VGYREDSAETLEVDVGWADIVVRGHDQFANLIEGALDWLVRDLEQGVLGFVGARVNQIQDRALGLADNGGVRIGDEVADSRRVPVIAPRETVGLVHALLDDSPFAGFVDDKGVEIELESVGNGVVVNAGGEAACAGQIVAVEAGVRGEVDEFVGGTAGVASATSADGKAEFGEAGVQAALEGTQDGGGDAGGVPVHTHNGAKSLEPEGIAEAG